MRKRPTIERTPTTRAVASPIGLLTVLSVSPLEEDHVSIQTIIGHSTWMMFQARDVASALALLRRHEIAVVICERDLLPETWIDVLEHLNTLPKAPPLIVTSRLADERLWAEALNLGAWDVLVKPLDRLELIRSVKLAWDHWHMQTHTAVGKSMSAAVEAK
jgi:DNA-binding NtrC family response regulator